MKSSHSQPKLAVLYQQDGSLNRSVQLAQRLNIPLYQDFSPQLTEHFFLLWREDKLTLIDRDSLKKGGLFVAIMPRPGEQHSWPAPKQGALAQALGRKTQTIVDATTGWGQDSLHIFRMGYDLRCLERSPVMVELLRDGFNRLAALDWVIKRELLPPPLLAGDARKLLATLSDPPDCIYLDPMFPVKRKKTALAKKSMTVLRDLLGDDEDREQLLTAAMHATGKRVVVKSPNYAKPLGGQPNMSFRSKLLRYDVYLKK